MQQSVLDCVLCSALCLWVCFYTLLCDASITSSCLGVDASFCLTLLTPSAWFWLSWHAVWPPSLCSCATFISAALHLNAFFAFSCLSVKLLLMASVYKKNFHSIPLLLFVPWMNCLLVVSDLLNGSPLQLFCSLCNVRDGFTPALLRAAVTWLALESSWTSCTALPLTEDHEKCIPT